MDLTFAQEITEREHNRCGGLQFLLPWVAREAAHERACRDGTIDDGANASAPAIIPTAAAMPSIVLEANILLFHETEEAGLFFLVRRRKTTSEGFPFCQF